ncbi:ADP-ribose pyrophosphatase YjhB (NUDIX family) [Bacillus mesophilus]|uniref:NUDIX hydrolase n=1 Tax=Bacillus mesophilus TaxID=1808955 RepID=A0A6M0Q4T1_9BACI|nr:NUDIX hydrolase [Bacillus mesophilus]MBM7661081.1 ADP-ribose pyrophosphatase YjhB (NUDIX family) [Bacillus mesophilus]NEY71385.1 NUDIX hydrolase [Bacillus mesophilus]
MTHKLAAGVVVIKDNKVLLVKQKSGWGLPKGSTEAGEFFYEAASRECLEETGLEIVIGDVAFIIEFRSKQYGQYLQVYYSAKVSESPQFQINDPDDDIIEVKFVSITELREYIRFLPWIVSLEKWVENQTMSYFNYDLDKEGYELIDKDRTSLHK